MKKHRQRGKKRHINIGLITFVVLLIAIYCLIDLTRPLPAIEAIVGPSLSPNKLPLSVAWPTSQQSAIAVLGYGLVASHGSQKQSPTASVAKVVTALAVLEQKPLKIGQQGPTITLTQADVTDYNTFVAEGGSVVRVAAGEQISEYQALQAMLLPSANNMADSLANWAFGSIPNYIKFANKLVAGRGMHSTIISDASGFSPQTVSTANDLVILGQAALNNPVAAEIVDQKSANVPVAGTVANVDSLLGQDNLIGIKTGNTSQAGGCFLAASKYTTPSGQTMTIVSSTMNAPTIVAALDQTIPLMNSIYAQIQTKTLNAGYAVASYMTPWGSEASAVTTNNLSTAFLPGMTVTYQVNTEAIQPPKALATVVGNMVYGTGKGNNTKLVLSQNLTTPSIAWRLFHPKYMFH